MGTGAETVGGRIRRLRQQRGLTQRDLAGPGLSYAYVSRIEGGHRQPSLRVIRLLASKAGSLAGVIRDRCRGSQERELRLSEAELELRLVRDLNGAEAALKELIAEQTADATQARARAALGILAARRGDNAAAVRELEAAARSEYLRPDRRLDLYETLAAAHVALGQPRRAVEVLETCLEAVDRHTPDDLTLQVRYRTFLGTTFSAMGELSRARRVLAEATELGEGLVVSSARVVLYWSLARVAWMQADADGALSYIGRAHRAPRSLR
jgi:transcriptional regulator with XRE-family HTH domain